MFAQMTGELNFQARALVLRGERQRIIAGNIANADTPGYAGRDLDFKAAMNQATSAGEKFAGGLASTSTATSHPRHIPLSGGSANTSPLAYTMQSQPSMDNNSVDLDRERANFVDNSVRYEATLRFINGQSKTILSAIQGQ